SVNTIRINRNTGKLEGLNTDMGGFLTDLAVNRIDVGKDSRVVVLGAGGAARAVLAGLVRTGARITVANRTESKAKHSVMFVQASWPVPHLEAVPWETLPDVVKDATLIVNTTSVGLWPDVEASPWPEGLAFPANAVLYDTVYRPLKTRLMRDAEAA